MLNTQTSFMHVGARVNKKERKGFRRLIGDGWGTGQKVTKINKHTYKYQSYMKYFISIHSTFVHKSTFFIKFRSYSDTCM